MALAAALLPEGVESSHRFEPVGQSVVRITDHSTVAVHTWPEKGVATVDGYGDASVDLAARLTALGWVCEE